MISKNHFNSLNNNNNILNYYPQLNNQLQNSNSQMNNQSFEKSFHSNVAFNFAKIDIQPKLKVSQPGDIYEQEADRISDKVMHTSEPQLQHSCACGEECPKSQTKQPVQEHERLQTNHRIQASDTGQIASTAHCPRSTSYTRPSPRSIDPSLYGGALWP